MRTNYSFSLLVQRKRIKRKDTLLKVFLLRKTESKTPRPKKRAETRSFSPHILLKGVPKFKVFEGYFK